MALLDVSDVLDDPDFYDATLQVRRGLVGVSDQGIACALSGFQPFIGVVIPDGGKDLIQTADGNAISGDITIYTRFPLTTGDAERDADVVAWNGAQFTVINAMPWLYGDGYTRAVCKLASLNTSSLGPRTDGGFLG